MVEKHHTVFISSTFRDLAAERDAIADAALRAGLMPIRFEEFGASTESVENKVGRELAAADLFVLLLAYRLGYTLPDTGQSTLEFEFDEARRLGKPIFVFMLAEDAPWPSSEFPRGDELRRLDKFRQRIKKTVIVQLFRNAADLKELALHAFLSWQASVDSRHTEPSPVRQHAEDVEVGPVLLEIRSQLAMLVRRLAEEPWPRADQGGAAASPAAFLGANAQEVDQNKVFVVMPYSQEWSAAVEGIIREACRSAQFEVEIAKAKDGRYIIQDIWEGLTGSAVTVADLTGGNPNVAYEVGLADVLGKQVILISQETDVPVDFRGARLIIYENSIQGGLRLREELKYRLESIRERLSGPATA